MNLLQIFLISITFIKFVSSSDHFHLHTCIALQVSYRLCSFIELVTGETEDLNHFICYKLIKTSWYKFDDHDVVITKLNPYYAIYFAMYQEEKWKVV